MTFYARFPGSTGKIFAHNKHMKNSISILAVTALIIAATSVFVSAEHHEEHPKTLSHEKMEEIMKVGFKSDKNKGFVSLFDKIKSGAATKEESKIFLGMLLALETYKVEKGEQKEFNEKADALVVAMAGVLAQKDGALEAVKNAGNCKTCHSAHKPD